MSKDYQSGELKDGFVLSEEEFQESLRMAYGSAELASGVWTKISPVSAPVFLNPRAQKALKNPRIHQFLTRLNAELTEKLDNGMTETFGAWRIDGSTAKDQEMAEAGEQAAEETSDQEMGQERATQTGPTGFDALDTAE
jgi:hypothetical protein